MRLGRIIVIAILVVLFLILVAVRMGQDEKLGNSYWYQVEENEELDSESYYFHQDNLDVSELYTNNLIRARVEEQWQEFEVVEVPQEFWDWNFNTRLQQLDEIKTMIQTGERGMPTLSGPHNGMIATHGNKRKDAAFSINNAVKGMGWLPKPEKILEVRNLLLETWDSNTMEKIEVLESLYERGTEIFDLSKQTSLELYTHPDFETQSFLNQMADPGVSIVFLDLPESYKLRCIVQMMHPNDPYLSDYEREIVEYINLIHDYFHGEMDRKSIGVVYHVLQVYDNSPGRGGRGTRIMPRLP